MKVLIKAIGVVAVVASLCGAQGSAPRIVGRIVDSLTGEPIPLVSVFVAGVRVQPDSVGRFAFGSSVPIGTVVLEAKMICFVTKRVTVVVQENRTTDLYDVRMAMAQCDVAPIGGGPFRSPDVPTCRILEMVPRDTAAGARVHVVRDSTKTTWHVCTGVLGPSSWRRG